MQPNPIHRTGVKNLHCLYYEECLDHAAEREWSFWDCSECPYFEGEGPEAYILSGPDVDFDWPPDQNP